jgi:arylsulfatase
MSGLDFFPTLTAIAGDPNIKQELLQGKQLGDKTYKVHLDGYDQTPLLTERDRPTITKSSISPRAPWEQCASMTGNFV